MKTLADFKRALSPGTEVILKERYGKKLNEKRTVKKVGTNSIQFAKEDGGDSWLQVPKATLIEFDGKTAKIYDPGFRDLNEKEKEIMAGEPEDKIQEERDMLTDGGSMFRRKRNYYLDQGYEYLFGNKKVRGKRLNYRDGKRAVQDDSIKGNIILIYEFGE